MFDSPAHALCKPHKSACRVWSSGITVRCWGCCLALGSWPLTSRYWVHGVVNLVALRADPPRPVRNQADAPGAEERHQPLCPYESGLYSPKGSHKLKPFTCSTLMELFNRMSAFFPWELLAEKQAGIMIFICALMQPPQKTYVCALDIILSRADTYWQSCRGFRHVAGGGVMLHCVPPGYNLIKLQLNLFLIKLGQ